MSARGAGGPTAIHALVAQARRGHDPRLIARLPSGWVMFGEQQFVKGYALVLPDPVVSDLNSLGGNGRAQFLADMGRVGDALLAVTAALRINYAIFGNLEPALHAHVVPRYADEPAAMRTAQPWAYDWSVAPVFAAQPFANLKLALQRELARADTR
jgi:diadenosine tetraphosphate (Ap4A) HIT family hydrolase